MTVHQHTRELSSLKLTKVCSVENGLLLLKNSGRPTQRKKKMIKRWSRKTDTDLNKYPHKIKGNAERERIQTVSCQQVDLIGRAGALYTHFRDLGDGTLR